MTDESEQAAATTQKAPFPTITATIISAIALIQACNYMTGNRPGRTNAPDARDVIATQQGAAFTIDQTALQNAINGYTFSHSGGDFSQGALMIDLNSSIADLTRSGALSGYSSLNILGSDGTQLTIPTQDMNASGLVTTLSQLNWSLPQEKQTNFQSRVSDPASPTNSGRNR